MNYVSYIKKQGFKTTSRFHLSEKTGYSFKDGGLVYEDVDQKYVNNENELIKDHRYPFYGNLNIIKHDINESIINLGDLNILGSISGTKIGMRWNQFLQKIGDDYIHIYLLKGQYIIILTDVNFSYISMKNFNINEMINGNFDNTLMMVIGKVKYRDYIINRI